MKKVKELAELLDKECPDWTTAAVLLKNEHGDISGWGSIRKVGEGAIEVSVTSDPSGSSLLSSFPR